MASGHQFNPNRGPDSDFESGELRHVAVGRTGRCLDPRRTPIRVVDVHPARGLFSAEILDFEDKGATWEVAFEDVTHYQFSPAGPSATDEEIREFEGSIERFDREFKVDADQETVARTEAALDEKCSDAADWLSANSRFFGSKQRLDLSTRHGPKSLALDLRDFMEEQGCWDIEDQFAGQYVRNPFSELVKGHRIAVAAMGLVSYDGKVVRDASIFDGPWSMERRREHILARLSFLRAVFASLGRSHITVYRGLCCEGAPSLPRNKTFVSTSFDFEIAKSCFGETDRSKTGALYRQSVPVERLFMSYLETTQMNQHYREAEAVLLFDSNNTVF